MDTSIRVFIRTAVIISGLLLTVSWALQAKELPVGPGDNLVKKFCTECHAVDRVANQTLKREAWAEILKDMRHFGADFTDQKRQALLAYLSTYLAPGVNQNITVLPPAKGSILVQAICSACHSIELVIAQRLKKWQWEEVLNDMIDNGAPLSDENRPVVLDYLVTFLGSE